MQYPTIGQPQYGFAPTMPGMASGGLASLPVKRFQKGGLSDTAIGGLFSPVAQIGPFSITPANVIGAFAPPVVSVPLAALGAYNSFMAKQEPAPVVDAKTAEQVEAQQAQLQADIAAAQEAEDAAQGLAMMNQMQAQPAQEVSPVDVAMDVANVAEAVGVDSVDAAAGAGVGAAPGSNSATDGSGGAGGDSGAGIGDVGGGGGGSTATGGNDTSTTGSGASDTGAATGDWRTGGRVMRYEQGGLAAAQQTQSKGRGQDTMLVHMTPGEVKGLQALAMSQGGSLTINPQTGLPEAGFLSSILPMVAGFALGPAGFGLMSSLSAGLTVGALTGVATGSLKKGLMAGLGAYGGAGLGEGLVNAATPVEAAATMTPVPPSVPTPAPDISTLSGSGGDFLASAPQKTSLLNSSISAPAVTPTGIPAVTPQVSMFPAANIPPPVPTGFEAAGSGLQNMFQTGAPGEAARSAFMKATPTGSLTAAGTTLASALTPEPEPLKKPVSYIRPYSLEVENLSGQDPYTSGNTRERQQVRYTYSPQPIYQAAQGGLTALNGQTYDDEYGRDEYKAGGQAKARSKSLKGDPYYKFADSRRDQSMEAAIEQNFAKGGLGSALPPRFLSGGGDGMSDSIKANIDGKQEARLADGEFVVPADVVSHLGNGSSKAGAKKLYAMMDKIRKARTGRERQAPEVNAQRYMPA